MKSLIAFALYTAFAFQATAAEEARPVKGTHVIVTPPAGFTAADRFPGYQSEETGASIMVTELPGPFEKVSAGMTEAGFKTQGITLLNKNEVTFGTHKGLIFSLSQTAQGIDFRKWIGLFGDDKVTYLVTATFPEEADRELSEPLKKAVLAARITNEKIDPFDGVTFRIIPAKDMKIAKVLGNSIILTKGGAFPANAEEIPLMVAAASGSVDMKVSERKDFAEARFRKTAKLEKITIKSTESITVDGLEGFESIGEAEDAKTDTQMMIYQVVLFDPDGYFLIQGMAAGSEGEVRLATFKELAGTFKRVKPKP